MNQSSLSNDRERRIPMKPTRYFWSLSSRICFEVMNICRMRAWENEETITANIMHKFNFRVNKVAISSTSHLFCGATFGRREEATGRPDTYDAFDCRLK